MGICVSVCLPLMNDMHCIMNSWQYFKGNFIMTLIDPLVPIGEKKFAQSIYTRSAEVTFLITNCIPLWCPLRGGQLTTCFLKELPIEYLEFQVLVMDICCLELSQTILLVLDKPKAKGF